VKIRTDPNRHRSGLRGGAAKNIKYGVGGVSGSGAIPMLSRHSAWAPLEPEISPNDGVAFADVDGQHRLDILSWSKPHRGETSPAPHRGNNAGSLPDRSPGSRRRRDLNNYGLVSSRLGVFHLGVAIRSPCHGMQRMRGSCAVAWVRSPRATLAGDRIRDQPRAVV